LSLIKNVRTSHKTYRVPITNIKRLTWFREMHVICYANTSQQKQSLQASFKVAAGGKYSYHCTLKCEETSLWKLRRD
jgi:hypothetical protein